MESVQQGDVLKPRDKFFLAISCPEKGKERQFVVAGFAEVAGNNEVRT